MDEEKIVSGFRKAVQDFLVPELREVVGELKQMNKREILQKIDDSHEKTREVLYDKER